MSAQPADDGVPAGPGRQDHGWPGGARPGDAAAGEAGWEGAQEAVLEAELAAVDPRREIPPDEDGWDWPDPDSAPPEDLADVPAEILFGLLTAADWAGTAAGRLGGVIPAGFLPRDGSGHGTGFADGGPPDTLAPGPVLAGFAADARAHGLEALSDDELIGVLCAQRRLTSWAASGELATVAELARRRPADRTPAPAPGAFPARLSEFVSDEIAAALTLTGRAAEDELGLALDLAWRLPATAAALEAGELDLPRAKVIADGTGGLDDAHAAAVEAQVLPDAPSMTTGQLRAAVARAVLAADPAAARRRREKAEKNARVERWDESAGTAALAGRDLPPADVLAADQRLCQIATAWKSQGAVADMDQLRARAYVALLLGDPVDDPPADLMPPGIATPPRGGTGTSGTGADGTSGAEGTPGASDTADPPARHPAPRTPGGRAAPRPPGAGLAGLVGSVNLTLPLATLLGLTDAPGEVGSYGPVDGRTARTLAGTAAGPGARWHVTITGQDGQAIGHGCAIRRALAADGTWTVTITASPLERGTCTHRRETAGYQLTPRLRHLIEIRNRTCTYPGCGQPAARCDADHTVPYDQGGRSCECNVAPLCRHHHRLKQAQGWKLEQMSPGILVWITPSGRRYTITPSQHPI